MHILYATDGSTGATAAGHLLTTLPWTAEDRITILTVVSERAETGGEEVLLAAGQQLAPTGAGLKCRTRAGRAAAEICAAAVEGTADLIVLGSHSHSALVRFFLGSVAEQVAQRAPCPVLVVRGDGNQLRRVAIGVDSLSHSTRAASWLGRLPLPADCEVRLVTVLANLQQIAQEHVLLTPPLAPETVPLDEWQRERAAKHLSELAATLLKSGKCVVTEIRSGDPAEGLMTMATDEGIDLLVVGSNDHNALERLLVGSVTQQVLSHAPCSVLVVRGAFEP